MVRKYRAAFSLVELLVVFSIIVILSGVLLPAVQSSREAARLTSCRSNVSQLAKGMVQYEAFHSAFPSGGWSSQWLGMAERPNDSSQPGGWAFGVLPYIEEMSVRNIVANVTADVANTAYTKLVSASLPMFSCPSRRSSSPLTVATSAEQSSGFRTGASTSLSFAKATRSDFAVNSGSVGSCPDLLTFKAAVNGANKSSNTSKKVSICHAPPGNPTNAKTLSVSVSAVSAHMNHDDDRIGDCATCDQPIDAIMGHPASVSEGDRWRKMSAADKLVNLSDMGIPDVQDGMAFRMSRLQAASVIDGLSNTYLIGEKYVAADTYYRGTDSGDTVPMMTGYSSDTVRWGIEPPSKDRRGVSLPTSFGSAHPGGWNVAYADGMVRTVTFDIDATLHKQLSSRKDGKGMPPQN
ncbi:MAG: DUF1559 domain-containing protein [Planctomycetes bacterium]|nr:DUF1559 domain-containing protein [Planctomycetota bacterium]